MDPIHIKWEAMIPALQVQVHKILDDRKGILEKLINEEVSKFNNEEYRNEIREQIRVAIQHEIQIWIRSTVEKHIRQVKMKSEEKISNLITEELELAFGLVKK